MSIQDLFYFVGIIFMISGIILVVTITTVLILLYKKVSDMRNFLVHNVSELLQKILNPRDAAVAIGTKAAKTVVRRIREIF
ncbi:MAG: hypothetical protein HYV40_03620 [Candidatus Levybacteria bacterium]|nr:hypothetical protein [Candidatus Levybacteria bacterium]